jgi:hypothetical protein
MRIDWFRIIVDLERARWSHERVAVECMRSKGWVAALKDGASQPRHDDGEHLVSLWMRATGNPRAAAPLDSDFARL